MSLAFLLCVEQGVLEAQAQLLVESIRTFAGARANAPIHTFQPRVGTAISRETEQWLRSHDCIHHAMPLNTTHAHYAIGNKIFVCAHAERELREDVLVFVDTDTCFLSEPVDLDLPVGVDAAVRPVDRRGWGTASDHDNAAEYWRRLHALCGIDGDWFVETTIDRERIRAYFNAGLIVVRRTAGLFSRWREDFERLDHAAHFPPNPDFADQMALAAALTRVRERVRVLDERYNNPLPLRGISRSRFASAQLEELIHIHYHEWFQRPRFLHDVRPALDPTCPRFRWLDARLPLLPVRQVDIPTPAISGA